MKTLRLRRRDIRHAESVLQPVGSVVSTTNALAETTLPTGRGTDSNRIHQNQRDGILIFPPVPANRCLCSFISSHRMCPLIPPRLFGHGKIKEDTQ